MRADVRRFSIGTPGSSPGQRRKPLIRPVDAPMSASNTPELASRTPRHAQRNLHIASDLPKLVDVVPEVSLHPDLPGTFAFFAS